MAIIDWGRNFLFILPLIIRIDQNVGILFNHKIVTIRTGTYIYIHFASIAYYEYIVILMYNIYYQIPLNILH